MPKIIIEIDENTKKKFVVKCAKKEKTQKAVLTDLILKWTKNA